jgi:hypothetical protein
MHSALPYYLENLTQRLSENKSTKRNKKKEKRRRRSISVLQNTRLHLLCTEAIYLYTYLPDPIHHVQQATRMR